MSSILSSRSSLSLSTCFLTSPIFSLRVVSTLLIFLLASSCILLILPLISSIEELARLCSAFVFCYSILEVLLDMSDSISSFRKSNFCAKKSSCLSNFCQKFAIFLSMAFSNFKFSLDILRSYSLVKSLAFFRLSSIFFCRDLWPYSTSSFMFSRIWLNVSIFLKILVSLALFFQSSAILAQNLASAVLILERKANYTSSTLVLIRWTSSFLRATSEAISANFAQTSCLNALSSSYLMMISSYFSFCLSTSRFTLKYQFFIFSAQTFICV